MLQDIIALTVQSVGGGLAATAVQKDNSPTKVNIDSRPRVDSMYPLTPRISQGGHIMLAGIVFQLGKQHVAAFV